MALTQMQIIQSLGEAMTWFERELNWGVPPTELRHLCGRIGELYTALINGQMATEVNQKGYDVVSDEGEKISVKTTAIMGKTGHISFNSNTLDLVDRVIILRVNTEEMQVETLLNCPINEALEMMSREVKGKRSLALSKLTSSPNLRGDIKSIKEVLYDGYKIQELETGSIEIEHDGKPISPVKPELRKIAKRLNINIFNNQENPMNTRQLGGQIIKSIQEPET